MVQTRRQSTSFNVPPLPPRAQKSQDDTAVAGKQLTRRNSLPSAHFLSGVQLDRCDVMSIPDPPSPPQPLRDLTPSKLNANHHQQQVSSSSSKKRSRASLGHVALAPKPSPIVLPPASKDVAELKPYKSPPKEHKKTKRLSIAKDDDDDDDELATDALAELKQAVPTAATLPTIDSLPTLETLNQARRLVRAFTLLSPQSQPIVLSERDQHVLAGYPLVAPPASTETSDDEPTITSPSRTSHAVSKQTVWASLGPDGLRCLDECKLRDTAQALAVTHCRVDKAPGGWYVYTHVPTNTRLHPADYEQRYRVMLEEVGALASRRWTEHFASLRQPSKALPNPVQTSPLSFLPPLLPLPSRDDVSSDPEIAAAEERLWSTIDEALADYSATVLAIRARRRQGKEE